MIAIREANDTDKNFIYATWLRGLYYGSDFYGAIDKNVFFDKYEQALQIMLLKRSIRLTVACLADEPDVILGWAAYEPTTLHFVYVKSAWRKQGLAKRLIEGCSDLASVTHLTKLGNELRLKHGLKFNPWLI